MITPQEAKSRVWQSRQTEKIAPKKTSPWGKASIIDSNLIPVLNIAPYLETVDAFIRKAISEGASEVYVKPGCSTPEEHDAVCKRLISDGWEIEKIVLPDPLPKGIIIRF